MDHTWLIDYPLPVWGQGEIRIQNKISAYHAFFFMQFESDYETNDANKNKNSSDSEREWTLGNLLTKTAKAPMTFLWIQLSHKIEKHDILWKKGVW